jgi:hypothetical protein
MQRDQLQCGVFLWVERWEVEIERFVDAVAGYLQISDAFASFDPSARAMVMSRLRIALTGVPLIEKTSVPRGKSVVRSEVPRNHHPLMQPVKIEGDSIVTFKERCCNRLFLIEEVRIRMAALHLCSENREGDVSVPQRSIVRGLALERFKLRVHLGLAAVSIKAGMQFFIRFAEGFGVHF